MRTSDSPLEPELRDEIDDLLPQLLSDIHSHKEMKSFLKAFFSEKEFQVFSKRLAILFWIKKGRRYKEMKEEIKVSSATIASAQDNLTQPGIERGLKILEANEWAQKWSKRIKGIVTNQN